MRRLLALLILCAPFPALAEPMTGDEFDAYTRGKTLDFVMNGAVYGSEEYLPNRRVRWAFTGADCMNGFWYERKPTEICFIYDGAMDEQCWHYSLTDKGIMAEFLNAPGTPDVYEAGAASQGLFCPGPQVGV